MEDPHRTAYHEAGLLPNPKEFHMRRLVPLLLAFLMLGAVFAIHPFQPPTA